MNEKELNEIVEAQLLARKNAIVEALLAFQNNPCARTFKDAENIPDQLLGQAVDDIVGQVLTETARVATIVKPSKKNSVIRASDRPPSN